MKKLALSLTLLATLVFPALVAIPAQAQNDRSWVASFGNGMTCSRASPCADFPTALGQTNAGGEINCVDQGEYGGGGVTLIIRKSITIDCEGVQARISGPSAASTVAIQAQSTDVVVLRGLDISGKGGSDVGIEFDTGGALHVEKCAIHDFNGASFGAGIYLTAATSSSTMELYVSDTVVMNNDAGSLAAGILVRPISTSSNTINKVILNRVEALHNRFGIKADGTHAQGGVINMTVRDSVASGNILNGIVGTTNSGGVAIVMLVDHSTSSHNGAGYGVIADGPTTTIEMTRSAASGNNFGIGASNGGRLISYQDNRVTLNNTDGSPTGVISFE
jgi:hypothetical protein